MTRTGTRATEKETRTRNRRGEGDRLRDEILAAVNRLLDREGSEAKLTMRVIATEAGVAAPSLYLQFSDKTELVWAALESRYGELANQMRLAAEASSGDVRQQLVEEAAAYCRFGLENGGHYRLMFEVRQPAVDRSRLSEHPAHLVADRFRRSLTACADAGYQLTLPVYQAAHTLLSGLHGFVSIQHTLAPGLPDETLLDLYRALAEGLLKGLVSTEPAAGGAPYPENTTAERLIRGAARPS